MINTLKQFVDKLPTKCLSMFDHFVRLAFKGLIKYNGIILQSLKFTQKVWLRIGSETSKQSRADFTKILSYIFQYYQTKV